MVAADGIGRCAAVVAVSLVVFLVYGAGAERPVLDAVEDVHATAEMNLSAPPSGTFMFMSHDAALRFDKYEEGMLTEQGEENTMRRLKFLKDLNEEKFKFLQNLNEIWVAPTRAAIQTAIMVIGETRRLTGHHSAFPDIVIQGFLRPFGPPGKKRKTFQLKSEGVRESVEGFAQRYGQEYFKNSYEFEQVAAAYVDSYSEKEKGNFGGAYTPRSAEGVHRNIYNLKNSVFMACDVTWKKQILMIADKEFGTYLFATALPWRVPYDIGTHVGGRHFHPEEFLRSLVREDVISLAVSAFMMVDWTVAGVNEASAAGLAQSIYNPTKYTVPYFTSVNWDVDDLDPYLGHTRSLLLGSSDYLLTEVNSLLPGQLWTPPKAAWTTLFVQKRKRLKARWSGWKSRMLTFAHWPSELHSVENGFISWSSEFGEEALGFVSAGAATFSAVGVDGTVTMAAEGETWQFQAAKSSMQDFVTTVTRSMKRAAPSL
mmetsp:Transcript_44375/g.105091  ORF Transcript_44375/g.105091 Transcript_44375/m.105091 type:complete len:484 (-) Transcript_44375:69-1520(-)